MPRRWYAAEETIGKLSEIEIHVAQSVSAVEVVLSSGVIIARAKNMAA